MGVMGSVQGIQGWSRDTINQEAIAMIPAKDLDGSWACEKWLDSDIFQK